MDLLHILANTFLFHDLPTDELKILGDIATPQRFPPGTELFREGDSGDAMYVIALGTARVLKKNTDGDDEEVAILGTGSYFGEIALINAEHQRIATVMIQEPTTLIALDRQALSDACDTHPTFGMHFYRALARGLGHRLSAADQDVVHYRTLFKRRSGGR